MNHGLYPGFTLPKAKPSAAEVPPPSTNNTVIQEAEYYATQDVTSGIHRFICFGGNGATIYHSGEVPSTGSYSAWTGQQTGDIADSNPTLRLSRTIPGSGTPAAGMANNLKCITPKNRYTPSGFYIFVDLYDNYDPQGTFTLSYGAFFGLAQSTLGTGATIQANTDSDYIGYMLYGGESTFKLVYKISNGTHNLITTTPLTMDDLYMKAHRLVVTSTEYDKVRFQIYRINNETSEFSDLVYTYDWQVPANMYADNVYYGRFNWVYQQGSVSLTTPGSSWYVNKIAGWYRY